MNNTNNMSARMSYDIAKANFVRAFMDTFLQKYPDDPARARIECEKWVNNRKLSVGELRLEVELNTTSTRFVFGVTPQSQNTTNVTFNTENRLPLQDSICIAEYGIYLGNPTSRTDTNFDLFTYGNRIAFPAGGQILDQQFYANGKFTMKCNNDILIPYRGLRNHRYRPQTQQTAAFGPGSPLDQAAFSEAGLITQEPNLVLIGSKSNEPAIELPAALNAVDNFTRAVFIGIGVYAQNSTIVS